MNKKITIFILVLAILIIAGLVYASQVRRLANFPDDRLITENGNVDTSDWQTYRNEELGFEVKIPKGWIVELQDGNYPGGQGGFWFFETIKEENGIFLNLGVSHPQEESINEYAEKSLNQYPFNILETYSTKVGPYSAIQKITDYSKISEEDKQSNSNLARLVGKKYIITFWKNEFAQRTMSLGMIYNPQEENVIVAVYKTVLSTFNFF